MTRLPEKSVKQLNYIVLSCDLAFFHSASPHSRSPREPALKIRARLPEVILVLEIECLLDIRRFISPTITARSRWTSPVTGGAT